MDPRAVELSDIVKFHPTEESLLETSIRRDDILHVSKNPFVIYQRKNNGLLEKLAPANTLLVSKTGGDFTTIKAAVDSITDNTPENRYTISVGPGIYIEDTIQLKSNVIVQSIGTHGVVVLPREPDSDLFIGAALTHLIGIIFSGVTGVSNYAVRHEVPGDILIDDCIINDCSNGYLLNNAAAEMHVSNLFLSTTTGTILTAIRCLAGNLTLDDMIARGTVSIGTIINISGVNSISTISAVTSFSPNVTTGMFIQDQARVVIVQSSMVGMFDGLVMEGGCDVRGSGLLIFNAQQDNIRINDVGSNTNFSCQGCVSEDATRFNLHTESPTGVMSGISASNVDKTSFAVGSQVFGIILDDKEDDEATKFVGELHVGIPERGSELCAGEGDSYTRGMMVYTENPSNVFVDISTEAQSPSGSQFTFPGIAAGNAIYVASSLENLSGVIPHFGIKTKVSAAVVIGAGTIIIEYWNGVAWTEVNGFETDSAGRYYPHAKDYFQDSGSHHIRYNNQLIIDSWSKNDPMSLGTDFYWIRFRITTNIISSPVFEQFKLHTNRTENNEDGWVEYFGSARPIGQLPFSIGEDKAFEGNLGNQTIYINENVGAGFNQNSFNGTNDKIGRFFFIPLDLDTSCPIVLKIAGRPSGNGNIQFTVRWDNKTEGDLAYTSEPGLAPGQRSLSVSKSVLSGEIVIYSFELDVSNVISRRENGEPDCIGMTIHSDVLGGLSFAMIALEATYTKWCEGGHI